MRNRFAGTFALFCALAPLAQPAEYIAFSGTYTTKGNSQGIYAFRFDTSSGKLTPIGLAAATENPSFLTIHQNGRFLYAVNEIGKYQGKDTGTVTAFSIDPSGHKLTELNKVTTHGTIPCHLKVDKTGRFLVLVNYGSGSTSSFPIQADGRLGEAVSVQQHTGSSIGPRQKGPHAHSINFSPDYRYAVVADLGLDKVLVYKFDSKTGALTPNAPPSISVKPGSGPRHFSFHPNGRFAYVINELASTVTAFSYNAGGGSFKELQTISTLPAGFSGVTHTAEVVVHPTGRFVYGSNRGHDSIAVFTVDAAAGTLTFVEATPTQGKTPRNFVIDPSGKFLLAENQDSSSIVIFGIDQKTGRLSPTGDRIDTPMPVCLRFLAR
ncbi:MAG: lactonase family protein [Bryobacteraceae bacterium]|nr:lactonase family protein [Bryobacteraceae bacterium]